MACCCISCLAFFIVVFVVYKIVSRLLRGKRIGDYGDRFVVVTGCDTGFGNMFTKRLDRLGCHVFAGCLTEKGEDDLKKNCSNQVHPFRLDVTNTEDVRKALEFVKSKLPSGRGLWGVVNNAGISGRAGPIEWMRIEDYQDALNVNTLGIVDVTMTFLPLVKKAKGRVVITSSASGFFSYPLINPYNVSKYGAEAFGDGLRRSMIMFGVKVSLIEPGMHDTPIASDDNVRRAMTAAWRDATPEVKEEFGDDYLEKVIDQLHQLQMMIRSSKTSDVVDAYEEALLGRYPRARYVVGVDANFLFKPLQALPECLSDRLLELLAPKGPTPAALRR